MDMRAMNLLKEGASISKVKCYYVIANITLLCFLYVPVCDVSFLWYPFTGIFVNALLINQKEVIYYTLFLPPIFLLLLLYLSTYHALCFITVLGRKYFWVDYLFLFLGFILYYFYDCCVYQNDRFFIKFGHYCISFCVYFLYKKVLHDISKEMENVHISYCYVYYALFVLSFCFPIIEFVAMRYLKFGFS